MCFAAARPNDAGCLATPRSLAAFSTLRSPTSEVRRLSVGSPRRVPAPPFTPADRPWAARPRSMRSQRLLLCSPMRSGDLILPARSRERWPWTAPVSIHAPDGGRGGRSSCSRFDERPAIAASSPISSFSCAGASDGVHVASSRRRQRRGRISPTRAAPNALDAQHLAFTQHERLVGHVQAVPAHRDPSGAVSVPGASSNTRRFVSSRETAETAPSAPFGGPVLRDLKDTYSVPWRPKAKPLANGGRPARARINAVHVRRRAGTGSR